MPFVSSVIRAHASSSFESWRLETRAVLAEYHFSGSIFSIASSKFRFPVFTCKGFTS
jgi:hypothetical protein